jgi:hypothetical protein
MATSLYDFINYVPGFKGLSVERFESKYIVHVTAEIDGVERTISGEAEDDISTAANSAIGKTRNLK